MKVLIGCISVDFLGGSQIYHYELVKGLYESGVDVTLCTLRHNDHNGEVITRLRQLGIKHVTCSELNANERYDLIVVSQPQTTEYLLRLYHNIPIISIIHSEVRDEDPVLNTRIDHYIAIRQSIQDLLINDYGVSKDKVSLIYNPIDKSRFKHEWIPTEKRQSSKSIRGLFVGEVLDPIRFNTVKHLVNECIEKDWELLLMSESKYDFNHPNIKYVKKRWNTEEVIKHTDFTAGILLGRTSLESLCCGISTYVYKINSNGDILDIELISPGELNKLCDSKYVISQHIDLYKKIISNAK